MTSFLLLFWKRQTTRQKATTIIVIILMVSVSFIYGQKVYYKYKYFKQVEKERNSLIKEIETHNFKIDSLTLLIPKKTRLVQNKSKQIDAKYKKDAEQIDNSTVTNKQLYDLLSKYD